MITKQSACKTDKYKNIEYLLKSAVIGTKIYVDNASQPYVVVAKNNQFIIAIRKSFNTRHLAFDLNNNICGVFIQTYQIIDFSDKDELDEMLEDLTSNRKSIIQNRIKTTNDVVKKVKQGAITIYGQKNVYGSNNRQ